MNNKNIINKAVVAMLGIMLVTSACRKNLLVTVPSDRISSNIYWKTDADATNASTAVYTYIDGVPLLLWDGLSDIGHFNTTGAAEAPIDQGVADAQNSRFAEQYNTCYLGIHAANYFMDNIDKITPINVTLVNSRKGEVRALRAYYYLKLVGWYGAVPLVTTTNISIDESAQLPRTDVSKIYDFISSELDAAAALLPATQSDKGRITKGAALALKARAMLYAGRYADAATAAKAVMDLNAYTLYPKFETLFSYSAENNSEVIMDKEFVKDLYSNNVFFTMAPASLASAQAQVVPTKQMGDEFEMTNGKPISDATSGFDPNNPYTNRDPRMRFTMFLPGDLMFNGKVYNPIPGSGTADAIGSNLFATTTGYNVKKYINADDLGNPSNCGINIIIMRYPEVLLTYAEAKIELNQIDQTVYDAINLIRKRGDVNMPVLTQGLTQTQLRTAVRHERTVELAFEGLHLFDIRRWKTAETLIPGPVKGITYLKNGVLTTVSNTSSVRVFNPVKDYLWPIPQKEITIDKNLTQNPGW